MYHADEISGYLERIGFEGKPAVDWNTLLGIQNKHVAAIPFENLNPLLNIPIELTSDWIYDKIVRKGRGGYCFEQNLLLQWILESIGFDVKPLIGRAGAATDTSGRTHLVLLVSLDGKKYLVDVGYGGLVPPSPLLFELDITQQTPNEDYRIVNFEDEYRLEIKLLGKWKRLYEFSLLRQIFLDIEVANWFTATSPDSRFKKGLIAARTDKGKRYTLNDRNFSIYDLEGATEKRVITSPEEMSKILQESFKINMSRLSGLEKLFI